MGFQMKIKKGGKSVIPDSSGAPKKGSVAFSIRKRQPEATKTAKSTTTFGPESDEEDEIIHEIDSFDTKKGGAIADNKAINVSEKIIIRPTHLTTRPRPKIERNTMALMTRNNANIEQELDQDITDNDLGMVINLGESDEEKDVEEVEYDKVPVDQFGAALLRGMGWNPNNKRKESPEPGLENRKKGVVLGVGAKAVEAELMDELFDKKKLLVPMVKRQKGNEYKNK